MNDCLVKGYRNKRMLDWGLLLLQYSQQCQAKAILWCKVDFDYSGTL